jgi:hypothetical protein
VVTTGREPFDANEIRSVAATDGSIVTEVVFRWSSSEGPPGLFLHVFQDPERLAKRLRGRGRRPWAVVSVVCPAEDLVVAPPRMAATITWR